MSFGYHRRAPPRRLQNLKIDEVSSVDRGANPGARVVLLKRHERKNEMSDLAEGMLKSNPQLQAVVIAKQCMDDANAGRLSEFGLNAKMQQVCKYFFGGSMSEMLRSEAGAEFLRPRATRLTPSENFELQKSEGWQTGRAGGDPGQQTGTVAAPGARPMAGANLNDEQSQRRRRRVVGGSNSDPDGAEPNAPEDNRDASFASFSDAVKALVDKGVTWDAAVDQIGTEKHRREKQQREW